MKLGGSVFGSKVLATVLLCFVLPLNALFLFSYFHMEQMIRENTATLTSRDLDILSDDFETLFSKINDSGLMMAADQTLNRRLADYCAASSGDFTIRSAGSGTNMEPYVFLSLFEEIDNTLTNLISYQFPSGTQACFIAADGSLFSTWPAANTDLSFFHNAAWLRPMLTYSESASMFFAHDTHIFHDTTERYVSCVRKIPNLQAPSQIIGLFLLSIPEDAFIQILEDSAVAQSAIFSLTDPNGNVLLHYYQSDISVPPDVLDVSETAGQQLADSSDYLIDSRNIGVLEGTLSCTIPTAVIYESIHSLRYTVLLVSIALILLFSVLTFCLIRRLLSPIKTLYHCIRQVEQGDLNAEVPRITSRDELGQLASAYNHMLLRLRHLLVETSENERRENELRFEMRMAQINPHFLFNTLNSIKWMAMMIHADNISSTIVALGRLLEISMSKHGDTLLLQEEIQNLKSYLEIQKIRYGNLFRVEFSLDPATDELAVPILILQPIVENAILHNIEVTEELNITVSSALRSDTLLLMVTDNGQGMTPAQVSSLLSPGSTGNRKSVFKGIGVRNVNERIQLKFGPSYGLSIHSAPGAGTTVYIRLPVCTEEQEEEKEALTC